MKSVPSTLFFKAMKEEPPEWVNEFKRNKPTGPASPYVPGEKCYVRETWCLYQTLNLRKMPDGRSFDEISDGLYGYKADGFDTIQDFKDHIRLISDSSFLDIFVKDDRWQSPAVMPMKAARYFRRIVSCESMRVRDISEEDARASGVTDGGCLNCGEHEPCGCDDPQPSPRETFLYDWEQRHPGAWAWRVESQPFGIAE